MPVNNNNNNNNSSSNANSNASHNPNTRRPVNPINNNGRNRTPSGNYRRPNNPINGNNRASSGNSNNVSNALNSNANRSNQTNKMGSNGTNSTNGKETSNLGDKVADSKIGEKVNNIISKKSGGGGKIAIPKSIKIKIYLIIGGIVLLFIIFILIVALLDSFLDFSSSGSGGKVLTQNDLITHCNNVKVNYGSSIEENSITVSNNKKNDGVKKVLSMAVSAEIFKMVTPLNVFENSSSKHQLGQDVYVKKENGNFIIVNNIDGNNIVLDSIIGNKNFYVNDNFLKSFVIALKTNVYDDLSFDLINGFNTIYPDYDYVDSNVLDKFSYSSTCEVFTKVGDEQIFYNSKNNSSDYLTSSSPVNNSTTSVVKNVTDDFDVTVLIKPPFTYDTMALVDSNIQKDATGKVIGGTYYLSDNRLEVPHEWLISNFPHFFNSNNELLFSKISASKPSNDSNNDMQLENNSGDSIDGNNGTNPSGDSNSANSLNSQKYQTYNGTKYSMVGAYYLATEKKKDYKEILEFFFENSRVIDNDRDKKEALDFIEDNPEEIDNVGKKDETSDSNTEKLTQ